MASCIYTGVTEVEVCLVPLLYINQIGNGNGTYEHRSVQDNDETITAQTLFEKFYREFPNCNKFE